MSTTKKTVKKVPVTPETATKEQIVASAKVLLKLAKEEGILNDICDKGSKAVNNLANLIGADVREDKEVRLIIRGNVKTTTFDSCDNNKDYKVEITYKGEKVADLRIDEACEW